MGYEVQEFVNGQVLNAEELNHMEQGIVDAMKKADISTDETLSLDGGVLSVNVTDAVVADSNRPVTAGAVYREIGNIEVLLNTI